MVYVCTVNSIKYNLKLCAYNPPPFMISNRLTKITRRFLNLQEFQSKELMNKFGLNTQKFKIISAVSEAEKAANDLSKNCEFF